MVFNWIHNVFNRKEKSNVYGGLDPYLLMKKDESTNYYIELNEHWRKYVLKIKESCNEIQSGYSNNNYYIYCQSKKKIPEYSEWIYFQRKMGGCIIGDIKNNINSLCKEILFVHNILYKEFNDNKDKEILMVFVKAKEYVTESLKGYGIAVTKAKIVLDSMEEYFRNDKRDASLFQKAGTEFDELRPHLKEMEKNLDLSLQTFEEFFRLLLKYVSDKRLNDEGYNSKFRHKMSP